MTRRIRTTTLGVLTLIAALRTASSVAAVPDCRQGLVTDAPVSSPRTQATRPWVPERTMHHDDPVIQRALVVVGQPVNPIRVVGLQEIREIYARLRAGAPPAGLTAFRATGDASDPSIYVNSDSHVYRGAARRPSALGLLRLAATLVHEQVHNTDGEFAAYRLQSDFVRSRLNSLPWRQQEEARRYLRGLDARAQALGRAEPALRDRDSTESPGERRRSQTVGCAEDQPPRCQ